MNARDVLAIRDFRNLWLGQAISQLGDSLYFVTFMFMVKKTTGSDAMVGLVGAMEFLPFFLLGPMAGVIADRKDRKRIMMLSDWFCFVVLLLFAVLAWSQFPVPTWQLMLTPLCLSCARAFFLPAKSASIPRIVPGEALLAANSVSMATQNFVPIVGLSFSAGVLGILYTLSPQWFLITAVVLNAMSFLVSALFIRLLPAITPQEDVEVLHPMTDLKEGFAYIRQRSILVAIIVLTFAVGLLISPFYVVYVATNEAWFGGKPQVLAWFECSFFVGMMLGSIAVGAAKIRRVGLAFIGGLVVVGLTVSGMATWRTIPAHLALNLAAGLALPFSQIPVTTYVQATVEDLFRGRVNSVLSMVSMGVVPMGMPMGGILIQKFGIQVLYYGMGAGMALAALCGLLIPAFRQSRVPEG